MGKKQIYKKAVALSLATAMVAGSATTALAGQWKQDANGYWWDENGSYLGTVEFIQESEQK